MDPQGQISALGRIEDEGEELIAIYHSHPMGPAHPSATDLDEAAFPEVDYLIWSPGEGQWRCEGFHLEGGRFVPLTIEWLGGATPLVDGCS
jgi:proteasome lid subunit RPN8/RPN11